MGYDLYNDDEEYFRFNVFRWRSVLTLAEDFGWEPLGTIHDEITPWEGRYFSNDGQIVTEPDAANLADALERALAHIPPEETIPSVVVYVGDDFDPADEDARRELVAKNQGLLELPADALVLTLAEYRAGHVTPDVLIMQSGDGYWQPDPIDAFSGPGGRQHITDFIAYCRRGRFRLY